MLILASTGGQWKRIRQISHQVLEKDLFLPTQGVSTPQSLYGQVERARSGPLADILVAPSLSSVCPAVPGFFCYLLDLQE